VECRNKISFFATVLSLTTCMKKIYFYNFIDKSSFRVSCNFHLKQKEAERKQKKGSEIVQKKVFVSLHFATKLEKKFLCENE
jgi:hypothetical protein